MVPLPRARWFGPVLEAEALILMPRSMGRFDSPLDAPGPEPDRSDGDDRNNDDEDEADHRVLQGNAQPERVIAEHHPIRSPT
jgi:hypothetical protein